MEKSDPIRVCLGGTFSPVHKGHMYLLEKAFQVGDIIMVGLTSDSFVSSRKERVVRPYAKRLADLEAVLDELSERYGKPYHIRAIQDRVGFADGEDIDAIVVSQETSSVADDINRVRSEKGLRPLEVHMIDMMVDSRGKRISSTAIHEGKVDDTYIVDIRDVEGKRGSD